MKCLNKAAKPVFVILCLLFPRPNICFFTVQCPELLPLNDGTLEVSTNGVASVVTRSCDIGFSLNGSERSTCYENGTWDISTIIKCGRCR